MKNKKLNLLVIIRHPVGGIRTFCKYLYGRFDKDKYKITFLAPKTEEMTALLKNLDKYNLHYVELKKSKLLKNSLFLSIIKLLQKNSFDLIHSHGLTAGIASSLPAFIFRIPHIMTSHDVFIKKQFFGPIGRLKRIILNCILPFVNTIHHVSNDAKDNMLSNIPTLKLFPSGKNIVSLNGIDVDLYIDADPIDFTNKLNLTGKEFLIGFMGRFMAQKGFGYLIEAIEKIVGRNDIPQKPLVVCFGWGGFIREEKEVIRQKNLDAFFVFLPFTDSVGSALKGLDVLAIPSLWEACPLLPMEALVVGTHIIGTDCIGLREVLKNTSATIIPTENSESLAAAIIQRMDMDNKTTESDKLRMADRFNVEKQVVEIENTFLKMIDR